MGALERMKPINKAPEEVLPFYKPGPNGSLEEVYLEIDFERRAVRPVFGDPDKDGRGRGWRGLAWRFSLSPYVVGDALEGFLSSEEGRALIRRLFDGTEIKQDYYGDLKGEHSYDAIVASKGLRAALSELPEAVLWKPEEWVRWVYGYENTNGVHLLQGRAITTEGLEDVLGKLSEVYEEDGELHVVPGLRSYIMRLAEENAARLGLNPEENRGGLEASA